MKSNIIDVNNSLSLKSNIWDVYYKPLLYTKTETDTIINNINNILNVNDKETNTLYVDYLIGLDTNNGQTIHWKLKTIEKALD